MNALRLKLLCITSLTLLLMSVDAVAAVVKPQLEVQTMALDTGIKSALDTFDIDATVFQIVTDGGVIVIPEQDFSLSSGISGTGSITVGGGLLTASFSNLTIFDLGGGIGAFFADLSYTGGSLIGGLSGGRIEGGISLATGTIGLGNEFTASVVTAKLGAVAVPIPVAVWLFGSGLFGIVVLGRKKYR